MAELQIEDLEVGSGAQAVTGKTVHVHYTGWLVDGTKFDSSLDRGKPFEFPLGGGRVIKGWDQGVAGMKVGGKRRLTVPAALAYGPRKKGKIPSNSQLTFELELVEETGLALLVPAREEGGHEAQVLLDGHPVDQPDLLRDESDPAQLGVSQLGNGPAQRRGPTLGR